MNNKASTPKLPGAAKHTTKRREWWGWFGSISWLFIMMYGYDTFMLSETEYHEGSTLISFCFMVIFALSIAGFGIWYGKNPGGLSKIAFYTTPAAIALTAVFALLPEIPGAVLYILSPVLFAPALTRRVFGILHTAEPGKRLTRYMSGITVCVITFTAWMIIEPPAEIAFLIPALLAVPAWLGVRRDISVPEKLPASDAFHISKRNILLCVIMLIVLFWLDTMCSTIHSEFLNTVIDEANTIYIVLGFVLPAIGFLLYGFIHDKGHERLGFICGMSLLLWGLIFELIPAGAQSALSLPMVFADGLGGTYTEFFVLTIPIFFLDRVKRPILAASLGVIINLFSSALNSIIGLWMPETLVSIGLPLFFSTAVSAVLFILLSFFLFELHREKTLAAALYALLYDGENAETLQTKNIPAKTEERSMTEDAGLTREEIDIAMLLIEGKSRSEITRKLRIKSDEANRQMESIRNKLIGANDPDPNITAVANRYNLTGREKDMLRCLCRNMTNAAIAAEMFLSEGTVRIHVRNLIKKLPVDDRHDAASWVSTFEK